MTTVVRFSDGAELRFEHAKEEMGVDPNIGVLHIFNVNGEMLGRFPLMHIQAIYYPERDSAILHGKPRLVIPKDSAS